ncbi:hypothetical protein CRM22_007763 [Opisthorchis felineus]|uniref:Uncharacterized protein n=1 Tax=Opisthorchis felineus TaxID=147828 RepID=A0A4S2LMQ9_OPIFE|nr:hypothetical protein CRM22_007763 [Opisthorchis felineus]
MNIVSSLAVPGVWSYYNKEKDVQSTRATLWCAPETEEERDQPSVLPKVCGYQLTTHHQLLAPTDTDSLIKQLTSYINGRNGVDNAVRFEAALDVLDVLLLLRHHVRLCVTSEELNHLWESVGNILAQGHSFLPAIDGIAICSAIPNCTLLQHYFGRLTKQLVEFLETCLFDSRSQPCLDRINKWIAAFQRVERFVLDTRPSHVPAQMLQVFAEASTLKFLDYIHELKALVPITIIADPLDCFTEETLLLAFCQLLTSWANISSALDEMCATSVDQNSEVGQLTEEGEPSSKLFSLAVETTSDDPNRLQGSKNDDDYVAIPRTSTSEMAWILDDRGVEMTASKLKGVLKNQRESCAATAQDESARMDTRFSCKLNWPRHLSNSEFANVFNILFHRSLRRRIAMVTVGSDPKELDLSGVDQPVDDGNSGTSLDCSVISLLLQVPLFATSLHGPLFGTMGCSIVDEHPDELPAVKGEQTQQFYYGFTSRSTTGSWMGAVGTGAGLPYPSICVSKSTSDFVSFVISTVTPVLISMMEADLQNPVGVLEHLTLSPPDKETPPVVSSPDYPITSNFGNDSEKETEENSFRSIVLDALSTLLQFLSGHQIPTSEDEVSTGIMVQIGNIILSTGGDEEPRNLERLALCMSDCLLLRSLCNVLVVVFVNKFKIPMSSMSDSSNLLTSDDVSSQLTELMKQYDYAIRALSEHLVDLSIQHGEHLANELMEDRQQTVDQSLIDHSTETTPALLIYQHLSDLWALVSKTCPAGLARQIMAHVSGQCLHSVAQLLTTEEFLTSADQRSGLKSDLWTLMKTAEFCLLVSSETISEVIGVGQLPADVSLIHGVGTLLTQTFVCRYMPDTVWDRIHLGGFYKGLEADKTDFLFALSNWLRFTNPALFPELPCVLLQTRRDQTELEIEWELFTHAHHFDPVRLVNLLMLSEAKLSLNMLTHVSSQKFFSTSKEEYNLACRLFLALFRICSLVPGLHSFPTTLLTRIYSGEKSWAIGACSSDSSLPECWPPWFRAILQLLADPITRIYNAFEALVRRHVSLDEALAADTLIIDSKHRSPVAIFQRHEPLHRSFLINIFPSGKLPCGCNIPHPIPLGPQGLDTTLTDEGHNDNPSLSKRQQATQKKLQELKIGSYDSYYTHTGYVREAWRSLAVDIVHSVISSVPASILSAFVAIEEMIVQSSSEEVAFLRGGTLGVHVFLAGLLLRVFSENENGDNAEIRRLQRLVLWEHLCSLLEAPEGQEQEVMECKKRMTAHLENLLNQPGISVRMRLC